MVASFGGEFVEIYGEKVPSSGQENKGNREVPTVGERLVLYGPVTIGGHSFGLLGLIRKKNQAHRNDRMVEISWNIVFEKSSPIW